MPLNRSKMETFEKKRPRGAASRCLVPAALWLLGCSGASPSSGVCFDNWCVVETSTETLPSEIPTYLSVAAASDSAVIIGGSIGAKGVVLQYADEKLEQLVSRDSARYTDVLVQGDKIWAVGLSGTSNKIPTQYFDGRSWVEVEIEENEPFQTLCGGGEQVFAAGFRGIWKWSADRWEKVHTTDTWIVDISCTDENNIWAVEDQRYPNRSNNEGDYKLWHFDGAAWSESDPLVLGAVKSISTKDAQTAWAVGYDGTMSQWDGSDWTPIESGVAVDNENSADDILTHVWVDDADTVHVAGYGIVLEYKNSQVRVSELSDLLRVFGGVSTSTSHWLVGDKGTIWNHSR